MGRTACGERIVAAIPLDDIVASVRAALDVSGLAPERLDLEITESLFVDHDAEVAAALGTLKQMVDKIKVDQALCYRARPA